MFLFTDLRDEIATYLSQEHVIDVCQAFLIASEAHQGQTRRSGEAYICHPVEVARILAHMRMDAQTIMAALLHDVIEDTSVSYHMLMSLFGEPVANLVEGVTKLTQIKFQSKKQEQAENFRKMMLAMIKDVRVILVKLADRLHNMRTLNSLPANKQQRIARETLEIFAPIAHRLGIHAIRTEYEALGFAAMHPMRHRVLKAAVRRAHGHRRKIIETTQEDLKAALKNHDIEFEQISGREKHLYSIYKKMRNKGLSFNEVMDVHAFRIIVKQRDACYRVLGAVHALYKPVPGRFKDYIAIPKANSYQSLHTTLFGPFGMPLEIQIRSEKMHQIAENGIAAHWLYKDSEADMGTQTERWLKGIEEMQQRADSSLDFIENMKIDLFPDEVYIFSPKGHIYALPTGTTAVDFAYAVHTDVGHACIAAKIDNRLMPLSTLLESGQTVEIITAPGGRPNPAWLSFVITGKARGGIKHYLKSQQRSDAIELGHTLLERTLLVHGIDLDALQPDVLKTYIQKHHDGNLDNMYSDIGLGNSSAQLIAGRIEEALLNNAPQTISTTSSSSPPIEKNKSTALQLKGTEGSSVRFARCCYPIRGDNIIGCILPGQGITVHRVHCRNALNTMKNAPEQVVEVHWDEHGKQELQVAIRVEMKNFRGALGKIANEITDAGSDIAHIQSNETEKEYVIFTVVIQVADRIHLARVIRRLRNLRTMLRVSRQ